MRGSRIGSVLLLAVAVAVAAVVVVPFLFGDRDASPGHGPAATPAPTALPSIRGVGITESDRRRLDVDGDGRADTVRLMGRSDTDGWTDLGYVEVRTASGVTQRVAVPDGYLGELRPPLDIDGDGRQQVWFTWTGGGESSQVEIYEWNDGRLVQVEVPYRRPAGSGFGIVSEDAPRSGFYVDHRLFTFTALDKRSGTRFRATLWKWRIEGARLVPVAAGQGCVQMREGQYSPCG
jgi:hypothetical protein